MSSPLMILLLESDSAFAEQLQSCLRAEMLQAEIVQVTDAASYTHALIQKFWDIILADFTTPGIEGFEALRLHQNIKPQVPFIFVSNSVGEQTAVEALKKGATDFVLKNALIRLPGAIRRARRERLEHLKLLQAEAELRKNQERLRMFAENADDIIIRYLCGASLSVEYVNNAVLTLTGRKPEDFYSNPSLCLDILLPEDRPILSDYLNDPLVLTKSLELRWLTIDGRILHIELRLCPIVDNNGRIVAVEGIGRDVTERKTAEEQIGLLSAAVEQSPVGIHITDADEVIIFVNKHLCQMTGYAPMELQGQSARILISDTTPVETLIEKNQRLKTGELWRGEMELRSRDGRIHQVQSVTSPLRSPDGSIHHYLGVTEDITQWKSEQQKRHDLELQLFQAQKMEAIGALAGGIAHDFNNILTAIMGFAELNGLSAAPGSEDEENLQQILIAGRRAGDLVAQILNFSRIQEQSQGVVDISQVVTDALRLVRASLPSTIEIHRALQPGTVVANPTQIHQIVMNLCANAEHAMRGRAGRLSVSTSKVVLSSAQVESLPPLRPGPHIRLSVADTGHGMDKATLNRIFERFFTTKKAGEGTGLGLSVVKTIIQGHQGAITVDSEREKGTRFDIFLPMAESQSKQQTFSSAPIVKGSGQMVFVLDDEVSILTFLGLRLERLGFRVKKFRDPNELLDAVMVDGEFFDLLITDQTMPGMTGLELIKALRGAGCQTPAILSSGYGVQLEGAELEQLGQIQLVHKPFTSEGLSIALISTLKLQPCPV